MSLITDTLNKMKKEQSSEENDDKMMAPPALRHAIVNTKKYQEFVKNAEIKDINGNKAPLKGFLIVSIVLVSVISIVTIYFLNKEDDTLIQQAGIVSNNQQSVQSIDSANTIKSLGKPYNPDAKVNQHVVSAAIDGKSAPAQIQAVEKSVNAQSLNSMPTKQTQSSKESILDSRRYIVTEQADSKTDTKQGPVGIIPANQLFVVIPQTAPVNNHPVEQHMQKNTVAAKNKDDIPKSQDISSNIGAEDTNKEELKKANNYTQKQVGQEKDHTLKNAQLIQTSDAEQRQNSSTNKSSVKDYTDKNDIAEVKAIKTKDPVGTVSASTISLYNQYVTTGNKAKNEGSYEKAIEYYTNALALNKNDALSANIANMYLELKNPNMAFQVVVRNGMTNTRLISILSVRMTNSKYFLESNKLLQYANTLEKSSYILFANGYYLQSQAQYDAAVKFYKDAINANPADVSSAYYAALCFEEQGKNSDAVEMYKYIINNSLSPENMKKQASARVKKLVN